MNEGNVHDVFKEVFTALSFSDKEVLNKIPDEILRKIMNYASGSDLEPNLDLDKPLIDQNISDESKSILAVLWQIYMVEE